MRRSLRRQLLFLHAYVVVATLALAFAGAAVVAQSARPQDSGEITVQRINVVDSNGTLRLVIANKDRMHPGVIGGKVLARPRPYAGLILFNDQGDEAGGITLRGRDENGRREADAGMMFDQLGQDQTIGFEYGEQDGRRSAAFKVWDRPDTPLADVVDAMNRARAMTDPAAREAAIARINAERPPSAQRVFVGKTQDRVATVLLADAQGRNRLALRVDADGNASLEFLDAAGNTVRRISAGGDR
jgi:hypothetical protein